MKLIKKASLLHIVDRKVLMVKSDSFPDKFITPGGKYKESETYQECLKRELNEEISVDVDISSIKFFKTFRASAYGKENTDVEIDFYTGDFYGEIKPDNEILVAEYIDSSRYSELSDGVSKMLFNYLKDSSLIN